MASETPDRRVNLKAKIANDNIKRQPHERDEAPDDQSLRPRGVIKQAASDIEHGLVDTDMRGTPGVERTVERRSTQADPQPDRENDMRERPGTRGE